MDCTLRIINFSFSVYENRTGISIKVTLSDGSTGRLQRSINRFKVMDAGKCLISLGYTNPDYDKCKDIFSIRNEQVRLYREAINLGKGKTFIIQSKNGCLP